MSHDPTYLPHEHEDPDQWHRHTADEGAPQQEHTARVNPMALFVTLGVASVFTIGAVVVTAVYYFQHVEDLKRELRETTNSSVQQLEYREEAMSLQENFAWEDAQAGTVRIPISQAMEQVVEGYQRQEARRGDG